MGGDGELARGHEAAARLAWAEAYTALSLADRSSALAGQDALITLLARGDRAVRNERDARVSIHHSAALGFVRGRAGVAEF